MFWLAETFKVKNRVDKVKLKEGWKRKRNFK
jgi:hypothetical protein